MADELKPCPFCGGSKLAIEHDGGVFYVFCNKEGCCAEGPYSADRNLAIAAWNQRANEKEPPHPGAAERSTK